MLKLTERQQAKLAKSISLSSTPVPRSGTELSTTTSCSTTEGQTLLPLPIEKVGEDRRDPILGRRVNRRFAGFGEFWGIVTLCRKPDAVKTWYKVEYDDGDSEEYNQKEIQRMIESAAAKASDDPRGGSQQQRMLPTQDAHLPSSQAATLAQHGGPNHSSSSIKDSSGSTGNKVGESGPSMLDFSLGAPRGLLASSSIIPPLPPQSSTPPFAGDVASAVSLSPQVPPSTSSATTAIYELRKVEMALLGMGFPSLSVKDALARHGCDQNQCLEYLLGHCNEPSVPASARAKKSKTSPKSSIVVAPAYAPTCPSDVISGGRAAKAKAAAAINFSSMKMSASPQAALQAAPHSGPTASKKKKSKEIKSVANGVVNNDTHSFGKHTAANGGEFAQESDILEDDHILYPCEKCSSPTHSSGLLLCDGCDAEVCLTCAAVSQVPDEAWFCAACSNATFAFNGPLAGSKIGGNVPDVSAPIDKALAAKAISAATSVQASVPVEDEVETGSYGTRGKVPMSSKHKPPSKSSLANRTEDKKQSGSKRRAPSCKINRGEHDDTSCEVGGEHTGSMDNTGKGHALRVPNHELEETEKPKTVAPEVASTKEIGSIEENECAIPSDLEGVNFETFDWDFNALAEGNATAEGGKRQRSKSPPSVNSKDDCAAKNSHTRDFNGDDGDLCENKSARIDSDSQDDDAAAQTAALVAALPEGVAKALEDLEAIGWVKVGALEAEVLGALALFVPEPKALELLDKVATAGRKLQGIGVSGKGNSSGNLLLNTLVKTYISLARDSGGSGSRNSSESSSRAEGEADYGQRSFLKGERSRRSDHDEDQDRESQKMRDTSEQRGERDRLAPRKHARAEGSDSCYDRYEATKSTTSSRDKGAHFGRYEAASTSSGSAHFDRYKTDKSSTSSRDSSAHFDRYKPTKSSTSSSDSSAHFDRYVAGKSSTSSRVSSAHFDRYETGKLSTSSHDSNAHFDRHKPAKSSASNHGSSVHFDRYEAGKSSTSSRVSCAHFDRYETGKLSTSRSDSDRNEAGRSSTSSRNIRIRSPDGSPEPDRNDRQGDLGRQGKDPHNSSEGGIVGKRGAVQVGLSGAIHVSSAALGARANDRANESQADRESRMQAVLHRLKGISSASAPTMPTSTGETVIPPRLQHHPTPFSPPPMVTASVVKIETTTRVAGNTEHNSSYQHESKGEGGGGEKGRERRGGQGGSEGGMESRGEGFNDSRNEVFDVVEVPSSLVGSIIGRSGDTIKAITRNSGCRRIRACEPSSTGNTRGINIWGSVDAVARAKAEIHRILEDRKSSQVNPRSGSGSLSRGEGESSSAGFGSTAAAPRASDLGNGCGVERTSSGGSESNKSESVQRMERMQAVLGRLHQNQPGL